MLVWSCGLPGNTAQTQTTHITHTHALGQNQIHKPVLCPEMVQIMEVVLQGQQQVVVVVIPRLEPNNKTWVDTNLCP